MKLSPLLLSAALSACNTTVAKEVVPAGYEQCVGRQKVVREMIEYALNVPSTVCEDSARIYRGATVKRMQELCNVAQPRNRALETETLRLTTQNQQLCPSQ